MTSLNAKSHYKNKYIQNVKIAYQDIGKGIPVVCFPGWPASSSMYLPLVEYLKDDYRLILPDIPGWAGMSGSIPGAGSVDRIVDLMQEFIETFHFDNQFVIGYSFGGIIAQYLVRCGVRIEKLVLISTMHSAKNAFENPEVIEILNFQQERNLNKYWSLIVIVLTMAKISQSNFTKIERLKLTYLFHLLIAFFYMDIEDTLESVLSLENREWMPDSFEDTEILVIYGDQEQSFITKGSSEISQKAGVVPYIVKGGTHKHIIYQPELSATTIIDFFS